MVRPSGMVIVDFPEHKTHAIIVGTVSGVFVSWSDATRRGKWSRLGLCTDFPLVLTMGLSYEPYSDTLVAATMGRGVYTLHNAKAQLISSRLEQTHRMCQTAEARKELQEKYADANLSSAKYFPPQK